MIGVNEMCVTYYTMNGRLPEEKRSFQTMAEAISHYRTIPMSGGRVLGMEREDFELSWSAASPSSRTARRM